MTMYDDMKTRIVNAENDLIEILREYGAGDAAEAVAALYVKEKIVKLDVNIGRYNFVNGAYLDADVIERAVALLDDFIADTAQLKGVK